MYIPPFEGASEKGGAQDSFPCLGENAPKVISGKVPQALSSQLSALSSEAYAVKADASGVRSAARTLAGVRWAAYSIRQLAIAKRAKELGYDAIHDTVHEMAKDEARHGAGFEGLYNRFFK